MQVEFHQLELRYADLRVHDRGRKSRLVASLERDGQQTPILVVPAEADGRFVLIDGYLRVAGLRVLGADAVEAVVLPVSEPEALVLGFRLETNPKRSALEEAWLLRELIESHGRTQRQLAVELQRSAGWVSRRLDLVRVLPAPVQEALRKGAIPAHAGAKYLVPLARANPEHCCRLVAALGTPPATDREVERVYSAWRRAESEQRERIVDNPRLYLAAEEATNPPALGTRPVDALVGDLESVVGMCHRAGRRLREGVAGNAGRTDRKRIARSWTEVRLAFDSLADLLNAEAVSDPA